MPRLRNIERHLLEDSLEEVLWMHDERRKMWAGHVSKHTKEYGLPFMYVGHVDLAFNKEFTKGKIISECRKQPIEQRTEFLRQRIKDLKTAFPSILFALCKSTRLYNPDILLVNERCIEVGLIISYDVYPLKEGTGDNYIHSFMYILYQAKYSYSTTSATAIFHNAEEEHEAVSIMEYALNGTEFDYPDKVIDTSKAKQDPPDTHPSFFGNSLQRPEKEIKDRLLHQGFKQDFRGFLKEIGGEQFYFHLHIGKESQLINMISGSSESIHGYEQTRKVFDAFVEMLRDEYGPWGLKITDIPVGTRKNSIMKGLREGTISVSASYTWQHIDLEPSVVSVYIFAHEGQEAYIHYVLCDRINERESELAHKKALMEARLRRKNNQKTNKKRNNTP